MTVELLSVADVARITGLSEYTVRAAIRDGELKAAKLRARWRVHPDELADWVDRGHARATGPAPAESAQVAPRPLSPAPTGGYRQAARSRRRAA